MDLTSLGFLVAAIFGLIAGDAVFSADTVHLDFNVAGDLSKQGIDNATAENLFDHHVSRITRHRSVVRPAVIRTSQHKSMVAVLTDGLQIAPMKAALQDMAGLDPIRLYGSMISVNGNVRLILAGYDLRERPLLIELERPVAEVLPLLQDGAGELVRAVAPYHYALNLLEDHADDPAARARLARHLERQRDASLGATTVAELALFENLAGILALLQDDPDAAEAAFLRAATLSPEQLLSRLNLAFLRVHQDRYGDAIREVEGLLPRFDRRTPKDLTVAAHITRGVARWSLGQLDGARADFQRAIALEPDTEAAYRYWAMLERAEGDAGRAEALQKQAGIARARFDLRPELAAHYFWLSTDDDAPLRRRRNLN